MLFESASTTIHIKKHFQIHFILKLPRFYISEHVPNPSSPLSLTSIRKWVASQPSSSLYITFPKSKTKLRSVPPPNLYFTMYVHVNTNLIKRAFKSAQFISIPFHKSYRGLFWHFSLPLKRLKSLVLSLRVVTSFDCVGNLWNSTQHSWCYICMAGVYSTTVNYSFDILIQPIIKLVTHTIVDHHGWKYIYKH